MRTFRVSEIQYALDCRRQTIWYQKYTSLSAPTALWTGELVHAGLEAYYRSGRDIDSAIVGYHAREKLIAQRLYRARPEYEREIDEAVKVASKIVNHYLVYDSTVEQLGGDVVGVEERITVPFRNPYTGEIFEDWSLSGKVDLALDRGDGLYMIVDHKALSERTMLTRPQEAVLIDGQLTGYAYLWWRLHDKVPSRVMSNILIKSFPSPPVLIRNGSALSKDKAQATTGAMYRAAIEAYGFKESDYSDILAYFDKQDQDGLSRFFLRVDAHRSINELYAYEQRAWETAVQLDLMMSDPDRYAFSNPSIYRCGLCPFKEPCKEKDAGGTIEAYFDTWPAADDDTNW